MSAQILFLNGEMRNRNHKVFEHEYHGFIEFFLSQLIAQITQRLSLLNAKALLNR